MATKILCPTDFSPAATNAIEYAGRLAQKQNGTITLLHIQQLGINDGVSLFAGGEPESLSEAKNASQHMDEICNMLQDTFQVSGTHKIITSMSGSFEKEVAEESTQYDLTVIGTNGIDNLSQLYFGSHSYRVAQHEAGPVLIVPEGCVWSEFQKVAFATDYREGDVTMLTQLKKFLEAFSPDLHIIHVSENDTPESRQAYQTFCNSINETLNDSQVTFVRIIHENKSDAIVTFMNQTQSDLLVLHMEKQNLFYRVFHDDVIKRLTSFVDFPVLILHG